MGVLHKLLWFCQILVTLQNATGVRRDASLSNVEALYNTYKSRTKSEVTYYGTYVGGGACALDPLSPLASQPGWIRVAAGRADFQNSLGCGMCVEITGSGIGSGSDPVTGTIKAVVHDLCGGCKKGGFDLYIDGDGRWDVSSRSIECPALQGPEGNIMFRFTGSNPWYIKLQARNVKIPAAGIEVLKNGKYSCLKRTSDNYFVGDRLGKVNFPIKVRVTSISGEQIEAVLPAMKNDENINSDIQFGGISKGNGPSGIKCFGQGNKSPYPTGGMSPSGEAGSSPGIGRPTTAGAGNHVAVRPPTEKGSSQKKPNRGGNGDFCENRKSGVHPDPDNCEGFILCDAGKTYRKKCAPGLLFNPKHLGCDKPERVKCRRGSQARPSQAQKRGNLNLAVKPAVEIVIQKERTQDTHAALSNTEGIQVIRPNEDNLKTKTKNGNLEAETSTTAYESKGVAANASRMNPLNQTPAVNNTATVTKEGGQTTTEDRRKAGSAQYESNFVLNTNDTSSPNNGQDSTQKGGPQSTPSKALFLVARIGESAEKGGKDTPSTGVNGTANEGTEGYQSGIITDLSHKPSNRYVLHEGRANTSGNDASVSTNASASKALGMTSVSQHGGGELETILNAAEREKQGIAPIQPGTATGVSLNTKVPQQGLAKEGSLKILPHQGVSVSGEQEGSNTVALQQTAVSSHGNEPGVLSGTEHMKPNGQETAQRANSNGSDVDVVTLGELETSSHFKPAVSKEKEKSTPLVGITIKQTGHADKYVLVNKRHKLRTSNKHHAHA